MEGRREDDKNGYRGRDDQRDRSDSAKRRRHDDDGERPRYGGGFAPRNGGGPAREQGPPGHPESNHGGNRGSDRYGRGFRDQERDGRPDHQRGGRDDRYGGGDRGRGYHSRGGPDHRGGGFNRYRGGNSFGGDGRDAQRPPMTSGMTTSARPNGQSNGYDMQEPKFYEKQFSVFQDEQAEPVKKDFYVEHEITKNRTQEENDKYMSDKGIKVRGLSVPRPVQNFDESNLPKYLVDKLKSSPQFTHPTPIQS